ncbi:MAG: hypothetical protein NZ958_01825 [Bacteroidia bacterium]|nr:hypothetical protein [Bacteroidia bacterium]MDW8089082.1 hypothetical protein [Bacteroidia bacterium]
MRLAVIGPPQDVHVRRWGEALRAAGAEVLFVGVEKAPPDLTPYYCIGPPVEKPTFWIFWQRRRALRAFLVAQRVDLAHPIHLTPSGVWVWLSGFRPYLPYAMGADVLEYGPKRPALRRSWSLQSASPSLLLYLRTFLRRNLMPALLRATLRQSLAVVADNYELSFTCKFFTKTKKIIELPAGIQVASRAEFERRGILVGRGTTYLYQADIILEGVRRYLAEGGQQPIYWLRGLYSPHPTLLRQIRQLGQEYKNRFYFFENILSPVRLWRLWQEVAAFISAPVYDGYSYAVAEGRLAGSLPIVNAIPAHLEILTHGYNAYIVEPFTAARLAQALHEVEEWLAGPPFWAGPNAEWVQRFSDLAQAAHWFLRFVRENLLPLRRNGGYSSGG